MCFVSFIYYIFTLKTCYFMIVYLYISFLGFILHFMHENNSFILWINIHISQMKSA